MKHLVAVRLICIAVEIPIDEVIKSPYIQIHDGVRLQLDILYLGCHYHIGRIYRDEGDVGTQIITYAS